MVTISSALKNGNFNSHAHVERDTRFTALALYYTNFNSHAHVERDYQYFQGFLFSPYFNSHAHVERDVILIKIVPIFAFQLTRSRGA